MFSKTIKKLALIFVSTLIGLFIFSFFPKDTQAMVLREKSLRESFFTKIIDEISLSAKQSATQSIRLNYDNPLGIEIIFRNPSDEKAQGTFRLKDNQAKILSEKGFFLEPDTSADFYYFSFPRLKDPKGKNYLVEIINTGESPLIVGYYNQDVYHYGQFYLGSKLKKGNLQFQIHYEISPAKELLGNFVRYLQNDRLFFLIWLVIIIFVASMVIILAKKYQIGKKKK